MELAVPNFDGLNGSKGILELEDASQEGNQGQAEMSMGQAQTETLDSPAKPEQMQNRPHATSPEPRYKYFEEYTIRSLIIR